MHDVIIVGGGPAGLSAALVLGRCRRRVLVIDAGHPRNAVSHAMHGYLSRDGMPPADFLRVCHEQLLTYPSIQLRHGKVDSAARSTGRFTVTLEDGSQESARILLLATGIQDAVPKVEGLQELYGRSVHLCPYCDGWEHRDQPIIVYGRGQAGADLALEMLGWSEQISLCTDGEKLEIPSPCLRKLDRHHVGIYDAPIARAEGKDGQISGVRFRDGEFLPCQALFFAAEQDQCTALAKDLGCTFCSDGPTVQHEETKATGVPGLYVAGNTSTGLQLVIIAAAEGTQAAFTINQALLEADI